LKKVRRSACVMYHMELVLSTGLEAREIDGETDGPEMKPCLRCEVRFNVDVDVDPPGSPPLWENQMAQTTILVVEDNKDHATLIEAIFSRGYTQAKVHVAVKGEGAKRYLGGEWPSYEDDEEYCPLPTLIVLDLWLPDMTGLDILEWMSEHERLRDIPVIMFSASTNPEHARRAYALGVRRCLQKPAHFGDLVDAVKDEIASLEESQAQQATGG
jgi:CheY-like chemotaxis protein